MERPHQERDRESQDPADRIEPTMTEQSDDEGVPESRRAANAGGTMSGTTRSRDRDLDDEVG